MHSELSRELSRSCSWAPQFPGEKHFILSNQEKEWQADSIILTWSCYPPVDGPVLEIQFQPPAAPASSPRRCERMWLCQHPKEHTPRLTWHCKRIWWQRRNWLIKCNLLDGRFQCLTRLSSSAPLPPHIWFWLPPVEQLWSPSQPRKSPKNKEARSNLVAFQIRRFVQIVDQPLLHYHFLFELISCVSVCVCVCVNVKSSHLICV